MVETLAAARQRDPRASRAVVDFLLPVIRARVARVLQRAHGRVDSVRLDDGEQDAWEKIWAPGGPLDRWSAEGGMSLANWVGRAAERATLNAGETARAAKRGGGQLHDETDSTTGGGAAPVGEADLWLELNPERLCPCLHDRCTERDLVIARMLHQDGTAPADVARSLATSTGQVYKSNCRFRAAFKVCIGE